MAKREYTIRDANGLHARPASMLVQSASNFPNVTMSLTYDGKSVNLKSILGVMSLGVGQYGVVQIEAVGEDATKALDEVQKVLLDNAVI